MKLKLITMAAIAAISFSSVAQAQTSEMDDVYNSTLYGAGIGALVGLGGLLLSDAPKDNLSMITKGAGLGIVVGAAFGIYKNSQPLLSSNDGKMSVNMPIPEVSVIGGEVGLITNLIAGDF